MDYDQILKVIVESAKLESTKNIIRSVEIDLEKDLDTPKPVRILTGLRRSGKSFLLKRLYQKLLGVLIPPENILFINFESDLLTGHLSLTGLRNIYETFLARSQPDKPIYLFLDEIQNVSEWEKFVRTIYDSTNHAIFLTGSNSLLLSGELASSLGGRVLQYYILPFSFAEFLDWREIKYSSAFDRANNQIAIANALDEYLKFGGFPETFNLSDQGKLNYRTSLVEKIIVNDVITRFKLESPDLLRDLYRFIEANLGNIASVRNISNVIKNQRADKEGNEKSVKSYLGYLEKTYLLQPVPKFFTKTKEILQSQKKYYVLDNLFSHYADKEDWLENVVFHHLVRRHGTNNVFFGRDERGRETNFVIKKSDGAWEEVQVVWELNDKNQKREFANLNSSTGRVVFMTDSRLLTRNQSGPLLVSAPDELLPHLL
ncbi:MAG: hypothetical protein G01um101416_988 [Microgenomates group bacterium Gr01-1014_16]|nr:MAG: hypothetical protein G01um101416_988 [Microgenomates group bacterium Gr01-1014_16]